LVDFSTKQDLKLGDRSHFDGEKER